MTSTTLPRFRAAAFSRAACLAGLVLFVAGCGDSTEVPTGQVHGQVSYEETPVAEGVISFYSKELGIGASADLGENGAYAVELPLETGRYAVAILPPPAPPPQESVPVSDTRVFENIPQKYRDPQQSELSVDITAGDNTFDVNMTE